MEYLAIILLALISCAVGFALEIAESNIVHIENDRQPNASAALFPSLPFVPLAYVGAAWLGNLLFPFAGVLLVVAYSVVRIVDELHQYAALKRRIAGLKFHACVNVDPSPLIK